METINHLNQQLHECQKQYSDLLTNKSNDSYHQLSRITEDKEKLEQTCQELQVLRLSTDKYRKFTRGSMNRTKYCGVSNSEYDRISSI